MNEIAIRPTTKIVISACYGGFGLSTEAKMLYLERKNIPYQVRKDRYGGDLFYTMEGDRLYESTSYMDRTDPDLVYVVETLGEKANGNYAKLVVEELPKGTRYRITEYDGFEGIGTEEDIGWSVA